MIIKEYETNSTSAAHIAPQAPYIGNDYYV